MCENDKLARDATRYLDGLMSSGETREFELLLEQNPELKAEVAAQRTLKEVADGMSLTQLPDEIWAGYWKGVYRQIERGAGWFFLSVGLIIVLAFGAYHLCADFLLNTEAPLVVRLGVGTAILGTIILLVSIGRERYFGRCHERYEKEVER
jgi:hypothetical protein